MMNYEETLEYMYCRLQAFHRVGASAYKPGLGNVCALSEAFGNPHRKFRTIHIAGTNGKGSTAHTIAAILQSAGYRTGLYTSPHLVDFTERIRVDGCPVAKDSVIDFVDRFRAMNTDVDPSFFELATIMAFDYFAREGVDVAVVEAGLGGRLDSTNIIMPEISVITNISLDHTGILGDTRVRIASEKAGIIKTGVPVVIGESDGEIEDVFLEKAHAMHSPIYFADRSDELKTHEAQPEFIQYDTERWGRFDGELTGDCQWLNARTVLTAIGVLKDRGWNIDAENVHAGFGKVCELTGLMGRWMKIGDKPLTICDTGHNTGGWQYLGPRLKRMPGRLHIVVGFVNDKDITHILDYMPADAEYYFVQPSTPRAARSEDVAELARRHKLTGRSYPSVKEGYEAALADAGSGDSVFVGGSNFVVADLLALKTD